MQTFEDYVIEEGFKEVLTKFNNAMTDFQDARRLDLDFDSIKSHVDSFITHAEKTKMKSLVDKQDVKQLKKLSVALKSAKKDTLKDRAALGRLQKHFKPVLDRHGIRPR